MHFKSTRAPTQSGRAARAVPLLLLLAAQALAPALARGAQARARSDSAPLSSTQQKPVAQPKPVAAGPEAARDAALEQLVRELRALRKGVVTAVVRALSGLAPTPAEVGSSAAIDLDDDQARSVLEVLKPLRKKPLVDELEVCVQTSAPDRTAIGVLRVLAEYGSSSELRLATRVAVTGRATEGPDPALNAALRAAVHRILRRDPDGYDKLPNLVRSSGAEVAQSLVLATADAVDPRGLDALAELLGWNAEFNGIVLRQIGRLAETCVVQSKRRVLDAVRPFLLSNEGHLACDAAIASGRLEDFDAIDPLIELLGREDPSVLKAAAWALDHLTALSYPPDQTRWQSWLVMEDHWLTSVAPGLVADLADPDAAKVVNALSELSSRRYRRDRIADWLTPVLRDSRVQIRRLACMALGRLGAKAALAPLAECMNDADSDVAREAWNSLRAITGKNLPQDAAVWKVLCVTGSGDRPSSSQ